MYLCLPIDTISANSVCLNHAVRLSISPYHLCISGPPTMPLVRPSIHISTHPLPALHSTRYPTTTLTPSIIRQRRRECQGLLL